MLHKDGNALLFLASFHLLRCPGRTKKSLATLKKAKFIAEIHKDMKRIRLQQETGDPQLSDIKLTSSIGRFQHDNHKVKTEVWFAISSSRP